MAAWLGLSLSTVATFCLFLGVGGSSLLPAAFLQATPGTPPTFRSRPLPPRTGHAWKEEPTALPVMTIRTIQYSNSQILTPTSPVLGSCFMFTTQCSYPEITHQTHTPSPAHSTQRAYTSMAPMSGSLRSPNQSPELRP